MCLSMTACMAAILNNLRILKPNAQGFTSGPAPNGFGTQRLRIMKKKHIKKSCIMSQNKINQGCCVCLWPHAWRPFWIICIFWKCLRFHIWHAPDLELNACISWQEAIKKTLYICYKTNETREMCFSMTSWRPFLNNLHILKKCLRFHILTLQRIWNQHLYIDKKAIK